MRGWQQLRLKWRLDSTMREKCCHSQLLSSQLRKVRVANGVLQSPL